LKYAVPFEILIGELGRAEGLAVHELIARHAVEVRRHRDRGVERRENHAVAHTDRARKLDITDRIAAAVHEVVGQGCSAIR
jgi:hypothetical protein